jgi:hypothetical protein
MFSGAITNRNASLKWSSQGPATSVGLIRAQYITGVVPFTTGMNVTDGSLTLTTIGAEGYWEIHPYSTFTQPLASNISSAPTYSLFLRANQYPSIAVNYENARIIKAQGAPLVVSPATQASPVPSTWATPAVNWGTHNAITGQSSDFTVSRNAVSGFSIFAIAIPPLPQAVEFIGASHECKDENVEFTWATASEHNSAYFKLETSEDAVSWETFAVQQAAGNTTELSEYRITLPESGNEIKYVRLSEYDLDGNHDELGIFSLNCSGSPAVFTYPNPGTASFVLSISDDELQGYIDLKVVNALGETVLDKHGLQVEPGTNNFSIELGDQPAGLYFVQVIQNENAVVVKHVVR